MRPAAGDTCKPCTLGEFPLDAPKPGNTSAVHHKHHTCQQLRELLDSAGRDLSGVLWPWRLHV